LRCPKCAHNQRFSNGMTCSTCQYRFLLNPKLPPYCADRRFRQAIDLASDRSTRPYTPTQVHGAIFRRRNRGFWRRLFIARGSADLDATRAAVVHWQRAGRDLGPIIHKPGLDLAGQDEHWPEPDLFDYGAEGILVVDSPILVDLLVRNGVHTTSRIAIVEARSGYPGGVVSRLRPLVAARPDLPLFLLHNSAADAALDLERQARDLLGAAKNPVVDLGLPPDAPERIDAVRWARRMDPVPVDLLPHTWLTDGIAAGVANRASFVDLLGPPRTDSTGETVAWILVGDGDADFG
jgi:hypothetical protein